MPLRAVRHGGKNVDVGASFPWPWIAGEQRAPLNLRTLNDGELGNLARYRGALAVNTNPRKREHTEALEGLRAAFDELIRRGFGC